MEASQRSEGQICYSTYSDHKYEFTHIYKTRNHEKCIKCPDRVKEDLKEKHLKPAANHPHDQNKENVSPNADSVLAALTNNSLTCNKCSNSITLRQYTSLVHLYL